MQKDVKDAEKAMAEHSKQKQWLWKEELVEQRLKLKG